VQSSPEDVLAFWFGREGEPGYGEFRDQWFRKDEAFDREVTDRFGDRELPAFQKMFLYMPFMHAESVEDQRRSVELFEGLAAEPGGPDVVEYAVGHRDIVERFGRFPHRNAILGRETTPEEAEFLTQPGSSF
jgi:uncharacterized protein (DUF924 family)